MVLSITAQMELLPGLLQQPAEFLKSETVGTGKTCDIGHVCFQFRFQFRLVYSL